MKILITGATGYIGLNLVAKLKNTDHELVALVRNSSPTSRLPKDVTIVEGDILDDESLDDAMTGVDVVVHFAAMLDGPTSKMKEVNVTGTKRVLNAAEQNGVEHFIFTSTINAHPDVPEPASTTYEETKVEAEELLSDSSYSFTHSTIYPTFVFGPRDYRLTRFGFFKKVLSNPLLAPPLYRHGEHNIVHVKDIVDTIVQILNDSGDDRYIVSGENVSSRQFYKTIENVVDGRCIIVPFPFILTKRVIVPILNRLYEAGHMPIRADQFAERKNLGPVPKRFRNRSPASTTSLKQTIEDTYKWYQEVGLL